MATPKLQGLAKALSMLEHDMEHGAGKLIARIEDVGSRGKAAMAKSHSKLDGIGSQVAEVESFVTALEGANGGDPLDDSPNGAEVAPDATVQPAVPPAERTVVAGKTL